MKRVLRVLRLVIAVSALLFAVSGCDLFDAILGNMTVQITTYNTTAIWNIE